MNQAADAFMSIFGFKRAVCLSCAHSFMDQHEEIICSETGKPIDGRCDAYEYAPGTDAAEWLKKMETETEQVVK